MGQIEEIQGVRQRPEEGFRRWFSNEYFDIVFWYDEEGGVLTGMQFCYGKPHADKAFTWEGTTQSHHYVSERRKSAAATGILKGDAGTIPLQVVSRFDEESEKMDSWMILMIHDKIEAYNKRQDSKVNS